ncbi:MAG: hypothetical protein AAF628_02880 [Planctomycetota bacterium]
MPAFAQRWALPLLVALAPACGAPPPPNFDWFPALAELHAQQDLSLPMPGLRAGFDPTTAVTEPAVGDEIVYVLDLDVPPTSERWFLHFFVQEPADAKDLVTMAVRVYDADGEERGRGRERVHRRHLSSGLYRAAEVLSVGPDGGVPADEAVQILSDGVSSMIAVLSIVRHNEDLAPLLWRVVERPSVWSVVTNLGVRTDITLSRSVPWDGASMGWHGQGLRTPLAVRFNGRPALDCSIATVPPNAPVHVCAGILSLVASRPGDSGITLKMTAVSARRRGPPAQ